MTTLPLRIEKLPENPRLRAGKLFANWSERLKIYTLAGCTKFTENI
jgi:hypothetical protein